MAYDRGPPLGDPPIYAQKEEFLIQIVLVLTNIGYTR